MCYAKPGPRCSNHTKEDLKRAKQDLVEKRGIAEKYPDNQLAQLNLETAQQELAKAREDYLTSPEGIEHLNKKADAATDPAEAEKYRKDAEYFAKKREDQMAAYKRVKHLPAERREWDYDEESGYADGWNVEEDTDNEPLINVHTGNGDDYLAENKLTELHGWTTDDAGGSEEEPIYIDRTAQGGGLETVAVRSVELDNVVSGESRTIYRLDQGDGSFNTFGSRDEVEAEAEKMSGDVISKEEYDALSEEQEEEQYEAHFGTAAALEAGLDEYDDEGYNRLNLDPDGYDREGFTVGDSYNDPVDREGFTATSYLGYQFAREGASGLGGEYVGPIRRSGHNEEGFKIANYDAKGAKAELDKGGASNPLTHISYLEQEYRYHENGTGAEDHPEVLEDMDKKDRSLPFHHEETGTLFNRAGKDYWGRTRDEAKAALQESLASGEW